DARERAPDALFDDACRDLHDAVSQRWMSRLPGLPDEEQRARVFGFPLQLQRLQPSLRRLIRAVYDSGAPGEKPLFRGFYFTSASPTGGGVDLVFKPVTESLGVVPAAAPAPPM